MLWVTIILCVYASITAPTRPKVNSRVFSPAGRARKEGGELWSGIQTRGERREEKGPNVENNDITIVVKQGDIKYQRMKLGRAGRTER
jgi:hypothetical protein